MKYQLTSAALTLGAAALLVAAAATPQPLPPEFAFGSSLDQWRDRIGVVVRTERAPLPPLKCQPTAFLDNAPSGPSGDVQLALLQASLAESQDRVLRGLEIRLPSSTTGARAVIDEPLLAELIISLKSLLADAARPAAIPDATVDVHLRHTSGLILTAATGAHGERLVTLQTEYAPTQEIVWVLENDLLTALDGARQKLAALRK